jgi:hypothetical protein
MSIEGSQENHVCIKVLVSVSLGAFPQLALPGIVARAYAHSGLFRFAAVGCHSRLW